jgi:hypothetical protein
METGMATDMRQARQRAIARALANGGAAAVRRVRLGLYKVESSTRPGTVHTVSVDAGGAYHCSCEARVSGKACWHQASVYIAKVEHTSGGRVTAPAPPAPANVVEFRQRAA